MAADEVLGLKVNVPLLVVPVPKSLGSVKSLASELSSSPPVRSMVQLMVTVFPDSLAWV